MYYLNNICCICFCNNKDLKQFCDLKYNDVTYFDKLILCVPEMSFKEMNNQRLVCEECCEAINLIYSFRQKCMKSKTILIEYIAQLLSITKASDTVNVYLNNFNNFENVYIKEEPVHCEEIIDKIHLKTLDTNKEKSKNDSVISEYNIFNQTKSNNTITNVKNESKSAKYLEKNFEDPITNFIGNKNDVHINDFYLLNSEVQIQCKNEIIVANTETTFINQTENQIYNRPNNGELTDNEIKMEYVNEDNQDYTQESHEYSLENQNHVQNITETYSVLDNTIEDQLQNKTELNDSKDTCEVKNHMQSHTKEKSYECKVCNKKFSQSGNCAKHTLIHTGKKPYECGMCTKKYTRSSDLTRHMLIHTGERPFECSVCYKKFSRSYILSSHMRIHTGEKPYECTVCKKKFSRAYALYSHERIHTLQKPYECIICNEQFKKLNQLNEHMRLHGEKPYACRVCNNKFNAPSKLTEHMRTHTGEQPFECGICHKKFTQSGSLTKHMITHTGEKPFECDVCQKRFAQKWILTLHIRTHTGEKPYTCNICDVKFSKKKDLKSHLLMHLEYKS